MRTFSVCLPSGVRYWTVLDDGLEVHGPADRFLQHVRFGMGRAESTTQAYATGVALYLVWCERTGRDWRVAMEGLSGFMVWLRHAPGPAAGSAGPVVTSLVVRQPGRINAVLVAVREFVKYAVAVGDAPGAAVAALYELGDDRWFPAEARSEDGRLRVLERPRHRLSVPERQVDRASDDEALALLRACRSARDRLILLLMGRAGLRRGEVAALRRSDVHLALESSGLGCRVRGEHVHVQPREEAPRGARAKSRRPRAVPADALLVAAFDAYEWERQRCSQARDCDFVLVNLFREPLGAPMPPGALNELLTALTGRCGLDRKVTPHMLRHAFAGNILDAGGSVDELQSLLGHATLASTRPYLHPAPARLRAAVERVSRPRGNR